MMRAMLTLDPEDDTFAVQHAPQSEDDLCLVTASKVPDQNVGLSWPFHQAGRVTVVLQAPSS